MFKSSWFDIKEKKIHIRIFPILILSYIWTYGYMGALTRASHSLQILISLILVLIIIFLFFSYKKLLIKLPDIDILEISLNDIKIYFLILSVLLVAGFDFMNRSLIGDELAHSGLSQLHPIEGLMLLFDRVPIFFREQKINTLIWLISTFILVTSILLIFSTYRWKNKYNLFLISVFILLFFRLFFFLLEGRDPYHPPFRLFPLWLSSSIFSISNFSFRLPGLMALSFIGLILYKVLKPLSKSHILLWISIFSILTIPLLWNIALTVDSSIWTCLFAILFLLTYQSNKFYKSNFFIWFTFLTIFILMRQSLVFIIPPLIFLYVLNNKKSLVVNWKETLFHFSPFLVCIPFLFRSTFFGNPALQSTPLEYKLSIFEKLSYAITSDIIIDTIVKNFQIWWIFLFFIFLPFKKFSIRYYIVILLFIICSFIIFYSIRPILWGHPKYQVEYLVPLIVLGKIWLLSILLNLENLKIRAILFILLSSLLFYNLYTIYVSHSHNSEFVNNHSIISSDPILNYKGAFKTAKEYGYAGHTIIFGHTYGIMNEVLYNYTLKETKQQLELFKKYNLKKDFNLEFLYKDNSVKVVILSDFKDRQLIFDELLKNGFQEWKIFSKEDTTYDIISLIRNE